MIKFTTKLQYLRFPEKKFRAAVGKGSRECMKHALAQFLKVIDRRVPVWTGRAKSSVEQAAFFIGISLNTDIKERTRTRKSKSGKVTRKRYLPKDRRALGASEGRFKFPALNTTKNFSMRIESKVPYIGLNDANHVNHIFKNLKHETPWNAFSGGFAAFESYMESNLLRFVPRLPDYIRFSEVEQTESYDFENDSFPAQIVESSGATDE